MQPIVMVDGVARFQKNEVVDLLVKQLRRLGTDLNAIELLIATTKIPTTDVEQFLQQLGWSVSGISAHPRYRKKTVERSDAKLDALLHEWPAACGQCGRSLRRGDATVASVTGEPPFIVCPNCGATYRHPVVPVVRDRTKAIVAWLRNLPPDWEWSEEPGRSAVAEIADQLESGEWEQPDVEVTGGAGGIPPAPDSTFIPHPTDPPGTGHDGSQEDE